jgi:hypothetical protein
MNKAYQEGYKIIRIMQMDVFKYKEKWLEDNLLPEIKSTDRNHIEMFENPIINAS